MGLSGGPASALSILGADSVTVGIKVHPSATAAKPPSKLRRFIAVIVVSLLPFREATLITGSMRACSRSSSEAVVSSGAFRAKPVAPAHRPRSQSQGASVAARLGACRADKQDWAGGHDAAGISAWSSRRVGATILDLPGSADRLRCRKKAPRVSYSSMLSHRLHLPHTTIRAIYLDHVIGTYRRAEEPERDRVSGSYRRTSAVKGHKRHVT